MNLVNEIKKIIKGEVLGDEETRIKYSHDASLFEIKPEVIVFPKDVEDIQNLIKFVSRKSGKMKKFPLRPGPAALI